MQEYSIKVLAYPVIAGSPIKPIMGETYRKSQLIEIKSVQHVRRRRKAWGGGSGTGGARQSGVPVWVDAVIDGVHRGGAGFYNVYVPHSPAAEAGNMQGNLYRAVPSFCLRPRRRRGVLHAHEDHGIRPKPSNAKPAPKLIEEVRREDAKAAVALRTEIRRREATAARARISRIKKRLNVLKREQKKAQGTTRAGKQKPSRKKQTPAAAGQSGPQLKGPRRLALRELVEGLSEGEGSELSESMLEKASGSFSSRLPARQAEKMKRKLKAYGETSMPMSARRPTSARRPASARRPMSARKPRPAFRVAATTAAVNHRKKPSTPRVRSSQQKSTRGGGATGEKEPKVFDWILTWEALERLSPDERAAVLPGAEQNFGAFNLTANLERQKKAIGRLWGLLHIPKAMREEHRSKLFGRQATQKIYAMVLQQASWLRQCLYKLLVALRSIATRERLAQKLGSIIQGGVEALFTLAPCQQSLDPPDTSFISCEIEGVVEDLVHADAKCSSAILEWMNVSPWLKSERFVYKGEDYMHKIKKDSRFLETVYHLVSMSKT